MPPVFFARFCPCDPAPRRTTSSRSAEPIPCYGKRIPCFAAEQGIASKALGLLPEMTLRLAKSIKKGQKFAKFPVLFPVLRESSRLLQRGGEGLPHGGIDGVRMAVRLRRPTRPGRARS
jgi:hypothetical protein